MIVQVLVLACATLIALRCLWVITHLHYPTSGRRLVCFAGFGLGYVALALGAVGTALVVVSGERQATVSELLFLLASAAMIVFDRRRAHALERSPGMEVDTLHHPAEP